MALVGEVGQVGFEAVVPGNKGGGGRQVTLSVGGDQPAAGECGEGLEGEESEGDGGSDCRDKKLPAHLGHGGFLLFLFSLNRDTSTMTLAPALKFPCFVIFPQWLRFEDT